MIKIAYGESNFKSLIEDGCYYQDRTHYIPVLESYGQKRFIYLRPRRFGKAFCCQLCNIIMDCNIKDCLIHSLAKPILAQIRRPKHIII